MPIAHPTSLTEVYDALDDMPDAHLLAGGTDFMVEVNFGHRSPTSIVCLRRVDELQGYSITDDEVVLGAGTTWSTCCRRWPPLLEPSGRPRCATPGLSAGT
jgi:CO/xanthine dehydrogenase FAD-binding subunit